MGEPTETWRRPSCEQARSTPFCSQCGERKLRANDLSVRDLVEQVGGAVSNIDARLFRSVKLLLLRPGELTVAYLRGRRRYLGPVSLFFFANAVFFAVQSLTHTNIFSSTLDSHLHQQDWSGTAQVLVARHLEARHLTLAAYAPVFDEAVELDFVRGGSGLRYRPLDIHVSLFNLAVASTYLQHLGEGGLWRTRRGCVLPDSDPGRSAGGSFWAIASRSS